jgi:hypothetical protein
VPNRHLLSLYVRRAPNNSNVCKEIEDELRADRSMFFELINNYWSNDELKSLCFSLAVDYEELSPPFPNKVRRLIVHFEHRGRLLDLITQMILERPGLAGPEQAT